MSIGLYWRQRGCRLKQTGTWTCIGTSGGRRSFKELAVGVGFFVYRERVGARCRGHSPEVYGAVAVFYFYVVADWWDGAAEGAADNLGGLLAGGGKGVAERDLLQQCGDICRRYYLKVGIGGVVFEAAD